MTTKTYYCAWHTEKGAYQCNNQVFLFTYLDNAIEDFIDTEMIMSSKEKSREDLMQELKSQGWQVKEVVIVDKETFDNMQAWCDDNSFKEIL